MAAARPMRIPSGPAWLLPDDLASCVQSVNLALIDLHRQYPSKPLLQRNSNASVMVKSRCDHALCVLLQCGVIGSPDHAIHAIGVSIMQK